jgi:hypothetical protein
MAEIKMYSVVAQPWHILTPLQKERFEAVTLRAAANGEPLLRLFVSEIGQVPPLLHQLVDHQEARHLFERLCAGLTVYLSKLYPASQLRGLGFSEDG